MRGCICIDRSKSGSRSGCLCRAVSGSFHGGLFGGGAAGLVKYYELYSTLIDLMLLKGIVDDDQPVQELSQDLMPELFQVLGFPAKDCLLKGRTIVK